MCDYEKIVNLLKIIVVLVINNSDYYNKDDRYGPEIQYISSDV
jgi:hypothetical protein